MMRASRFAALIPALTLLLVAAPSLGPGASVSASQGEAFRVVQLHIDGEIEPVMAEYVAGGIAQANAAGAALILILMDTPGGLDTSMREIIQRILDSRAPVVVYVSPSAARAASAGFFILQAADIAAMAPGTHTGAASPLAAIGGVPIQIDETLRRKITNDATAYLRSYGDRRGRNVVLAESAVVDGKAFTEKEALEGRLIDLVADSRDALFKQLDGRAIARFAGGSTTVALRAAIVEDVTMSARQRFLSRIVQPDVFFVLLIVGVLGLYTEFTHPGLFAPGVLGGIALVLALFAMHLVPVNFAGVLLIFLALAMFILEAKYPTHGILGVGGVIAMLLGAFMLVRSPLTGAGVSAGVALGVTIPFAVVAIGLMRLVLRSRAWLPQTGSEELLREPAEVTEPIGGPAQPGMVRVRGELWRATSTRAIPPGARVRVVHVDGLMLQVEPERGAQ
jgi:membrane-bound serine protease (ClpP class)